MTVTLKDIKNMSRKIKRSKNPQTLARYQVQLDEWIAELAQDQAHYDAEIALLETRTPPIPRKSYAYDDFERQYLRRSKL